MVYVHENKRIIRVATTTSVPEFPTRGKPFCTEELMLEGPGTGYKATQGQRNKGIARG